MDGYDKVFEKVDLSKNGRDHIYLIEKEGDNKKFFRIADLYTLGQLGYPKPSRSEEKCFHISDGYTIGKEIKIYNIISEINEIRRLKDW